MCEEALVSYLRPHQRRKKKLITLTHITELVKVDFTTL